MHGAVATRRHWRAALVCSAALSGGDAAAQPSDAAGRAPARPEYLRVERLEPFLDFETEYTYSRAASRLRRRPRDFDQTNRDLRLEEKVGAQFEGALIDPRLIAVAGDVAFGLTQSRFVERGPYFRDAVGDEGFDLEYQARANLLAGQPLSGTVYGLRQDDRINRRFQPTLHERRTGFGTTWNLAHEKFPMELGYEYLETDRTGNRAARDDEHFAESKLHYGAEWIVSEAQRFKLSYEHAENDQEYAGLGKPFDTTRDLMTLEHSLGWGPQRQNTLRTLVHWQEESGDLARDFFEIGPQLTLQHGPNVQSVYKYQFNRETYAGLDVETHRADYQLVHQMYTNLTTTVDLFGLYEDVENDVRTTQYGGLVDWQYNRRNPLGHLYANLSLAYDTQQAAGDDGERLVRDESGTFRDPLPVRLRNRDVLPGSIIVTDTSGRRIFAQGRDYVVVNRRNATELVRILSGRIADGDSVLVDYRYRTPTRGQIDTVRADFGIEQRFTGGLTPYYRVSYRDQDADASTGFARAADRTDHHRLGLRYEVPQYTLGAELEIYDDSIEPYRGFHVDGLWHILRAGQHTLDGSARWSRFRFDGGLDRRDVHMLDVNVDHRWTLSRDCSTFQRAAWRWEDDSLDGDTHGWDVTGGLTWRLGDLEAEVSIEYDRLALPTSTDDTLTFWFHLRRSFPNVFARQ